MNLLDIIEPLAGQALDVPLFAYEDNGSETLLSRAQFRARAHAIASHLGQHAKPGDTVLLVFPPGPEFLCAFMGAICAGMIAVPVYPPDGRPHSIQRFLALIGDSRAAVALGTAEVCSQTGLLPELAKLRWIATDKIAIDDAKAYRRPAVDPASPAFIQYTSGSTGTPRGVVQTHQNILANMDMIRRTLEVSPTSRGVIWLPLYHDMGLITSLMSVHHGEYMRLMSPLSFIRDPLEWLRKISRDRASHSGGPNFAYDLCVRRATPKDLATIDLSCWTHAFNGAEPIRAETMDRFAQVFGPCGFRKSAYLPCYGLAEATLLVSVGPTGVDPTTRAIDDAALARGRVAAANDGSRARVMVASGRIHADAEVEIVDPQTLARCAPDRVGEIWVRGPGIGRGYWQRPEESEKTFRARIQPHGEGPFLRTGDLGFVSDGQLYVAGRLKDLIVIRGQNYYPQDIEAAVVKAHPAVRSGCCIAVALAGDAGEELAVFFELDKSTDQQVVVADVLARVREAISESFALAPQIAAVVKRGALPKTSSGKVQRSQCRDLFLRNQLTVLALHDARPPAPRAELADAPKSADDEASLIERVEARLIQEISTVINNKVNSSSVVTKLGITSLSAVEIMFAIEQDFGLTIHPSFLADTITVSELAKRIVKGQQPTAACAHVDELGGPGARTAARPLDFSLMYFSTDTLTNDARFDILLRSARFADERGFRAAWIPERHFHAFGGTYPNPSVAAGALAVATKKLRIRAGSVVLPLHNPIRVAEEWSMVDNLSGGRVDLSFATGWNPNDFVIAPEGFDNRRALTFAGVERVRSLWSGQSIELKNGRGELTQIAIHPQPVQPELSPWFTCTGSEQGFVEAGTHGYNILTALLFQRVEDLARKIQLYRDARQRAGFDPSSGVVTLMLHTFVGRSTESVMAKVAEPFKRYLASSIDLWKHEWTSLSPNGGGEVNPLLLDIAFERYARGNALFGTAASCEDFVRRLHGAGVDEIACLIDFGVKADDVIESLIYLDDLRMRCMNPPAEVAAAPVQRAQARFDHAG